MVEDQPHLRGRIHRVKPDGASIKYDVGYVRECTGAKTRRLCQVNDFAQSAPQPFLFECVRRHRRIAAIRSSATTARKAVRNMCPTLQNFDCASISTHHQLAI